MDLSQVPELLVLARSDAPRALAAGKEWLEALDRSDHRSRSIVHRAMCIAARYAATVEESVAHGRAAVEEAEQTADEGVVAEAMTTLAGSLALEGKTDAALDVLRDAVAKAPRAMLGAVEFQQATIHAMRGETGPALDSFSAALPHLAEAGDDVRLAMALHNRGLLNVMSGELPQAESDLTRARQMHADHGLHHELIGAEHNLGLLAAHRGDIPEALYHFRVSEELGRKETGSAIPIHVSRCEVLLSAGLFREALALATAVCEEHHRQGRAQDEADARLVGAQAAMLAGELDQAAELARTAKDLFGQQERVSWMANARRVEIQARHRAGVIDPELLDAARRTADQLDGLWPIPAVQARLVAGLIALDLGDLETATEEIDRAGRLKSGPFETRIQSRAAQARLRLARGDTRGAASAARSGVGLLDEYQAALGATDIRSGVERHAEVLTEVGLLLAVRSRNARRVYHWMERAHAPSLRFRPAVSDDQGQMADLARLRKVTVDLRTTEGDEARKLARQMRDLQNSIRDKAREARGDHTGLDRVGEDELADALDDRTLVEMASLDGEIWAVVVDRGSFRLRRVGSEDDILGELRDLRFMMRRLAVGRGSVDTAREMARRIDEMVMAPLRLGAGPLVLVPTPALHALPWWALPTARERPMTISPSAELWFRAAGARASGRGTLFVAGPDLALSDVEVDAVAGLYRSPTTMASTASHVESVQEGLSGARMAHIASHAQFQVENPMFSSLRLADGDLNVYDIERLRAAPDLVILSACDSGFTETHAGEELMGLSSALLSMGTRSIIASVGLVPDSEATRDLMVALHRRLIARRSPSRALHEAQTEIGSGPGGFVAASSFICIGAG